MRLATFGNIKEKIISLRGLAHKKVKYSDRIKMSIPKSGMLLR